VRLGEAFECFSSTYFLEVSGLAVVQILHSGQSRFTEMAGGNRSASRLPRSIGSAEFWPRTSPCAI